MRRTRGMSVLEVVIALSLLALGVLFVLALVPTGVRSIKRSEDIEAATAYALDVVEVTRRNLPPEGVTRYVVVLNGTEFKVQREISRVDDVLTDIIVVAEWSDTLPGQRLATRVQGQPARNMTAP